uniref:Uncharacterized protein n=1 Tax=Anguilla anguilla TaxID=7936 RepID=A0A0E9TPM6_ANGAN
MPSYLHTYSVLSLSHSFQSRPAIKSIDIKIAPSYMKQYLSSHKLNKLYSKAMLPNVS